MANVQTKPRRGYIAVSLIVVVVGVGSYILGGLTYTKISALFGGSSIDDVQTTHNPPTRKARPNPYWPERKEQFEIFGRRADVVMVGDSITHAGHWEDIFPSITIANRGITRDSTYDILVRLDNIIAVQPKKALLMIGINDFLLGRSVDDVFSDYTKIVTKLHKKNIQVIIQSTLECNKLNYKCGSILLKIRELNARLKSYAAKHKFIYIDINDGLSSKEGGLSQYYTYDGIHLRGSGYLRWSKTIAPYIKSYQ